MQVDHAHVAGELADALRPASSRASSVVSAPAAPARHRLALVGGLRRASNPRPAGRRTSSTSTSACHLEFYEAGIGEVTARDRYAGMLVAKHLAGIYRRRYGTQAALKMHARAGGAGQGRRVRRPVEEALARRCSGELGVSDEEFWRNYVLLQVFDRLSLWLCKGDPAGHGRMRDRAARRRRARRQPTADGCALDPYPLDGHELAIAVPVRVVPLSGYANDADCAAAILAAPIEQRIYHIDAGVSSQSPLL